MSVGAGTGDATLREQEEREQEARRRLAELAKWSGQQLNGVILRKHLLCLLSRAYKGRTLHPANEKPVPHLVRPSVRPSVR